MAKNFKEGNDISQFYPKTNPLAKAGGMRMRVERLQEELEMVFAIAIDTAADTATFTAAAPTNGYTALRVAHFKVSDQSGNTASNKATSLAAPVVVDTSNLVETEAWFIYMELADEKNIAIRVGHNEYAQLEVNYPAANPTININTVADRSSSIEVYEADGTTAIANGGAAYALGSFAAGGTTENAKIIVKNVGGVVLENASVTAAGDVAGITDFANVVFLEDSGEINFTVDASGAAGSYTGTITIASNDVLTPSFLVNVSYTLA